MTSVGRFLRAPLGWLTLVVASLGILCACGRRPVAAGPSAPVAAAAAGGAPGEHAGPRTAPAEACTHDAEAEKAVAADLIRRVEAARAQPRARARVTFSCTSALVGAVHVDGLRVHGHGGNAVQINLDLTPDGGEVRAVRLTGVRNPTLGAPPPGVGVAHAHVAPERARQVLSLVRAALAAHVEVDLPPLVAGEVQSVSVKASTHDEHIEVAVGTDGARLNVGVWEGYVNSLAEEKRAPLDIAWKAVSDLLPATFDGAAPAREDRALFTRLWATETQRAEWVRDALLGLAATLGDASVATGATQALGSRHVRTQILAVNALAAATGNDLRRNAAGAVRSLADVVSDYQRLQAARPARP